MNRRLAVVLLAAMLASCSRASQKQEVVVFSAGEVRDIPGEIADPIARTAQSLLATTSPGDIAAEALTNRSYEARRRTQFGTEVSYAGLQTTAGLSYDHLLVVYEARGDDPTKEFSLIFAGMGLAYPDPPRIAGEAPELRALLTEALRTTNGAPAS